MFSKDRDGHATSLDKPRETGAESTKNPLGIFTEFHQQRRDGDEGNLISLRYRLLLAMYRFIIHSHSASRA